MAKISKAAAGALIGRLACLRYFPKDEPLAVGELITALVESAESQDHAKLIVDRAVSTLEDCPVPATIHGIAIDLTERSSKKAGCRNCNPPGWIHFERAGIQCSRMCDCHPGRSGRREP